MKICPYCGESIQDDAVKCRYCKEWLTTSPFPVNNITQPNSIDINNKEEKIVEKNLHQNKKAKGHKTIICLLAFFLIIIVGIVFYFFFYGRKVELGANTSILERNGLVTKNAANNYNIVDNKAYGESFDITFLRAKDERVTRIVYTKQNAEDNFNMFERLTAKFNQQYGNYEEVTANGMNYLNVKRTWIHGDEATILTKMVTYASDPFSDIMGDEVLVSAMECYSKDKDNSDW